MKIILWTVIASTLVVGVPLCVVLGILIEWLLGLAAPVAAITRGTFLDRLLAILVDGMIGALVVLIIFTVEQIIAWWRKGHAWPPGRRRPRAP